VAVRHVDVEWLAALVGQIGIGLPSSDNRIHRAVHVRAELLPASEGQLVAAANHEAVPNVVRGDRPLTPAQFVQRLVPRIIAEPAV